MALSAKASKLCKVVAGLDFVDNTRYVAATCLTKQDFFAYEGDVVRDKDGNPRKGKFGKVVREQPFAELFREAGFKWALGAYRIAVKNDEDKALYLALAETYCEKFAVAVEKGIVPAEKAKTTEKPPVGARLAAIDALLAGA